MTGLELYNGEVNLRSKFINYYGDFITIIGAQIQMSYKFNRVAKFELENFKRVVEIFCLSIDFRSMLLDQKCFQYC